ncbi:MAG: 6-phosphogluconolactonase [Bacteroidetes bacterium]|nr:6-phosphogluconolactonase [Bacteroidota bacterium]
MPNSTETYREHLPVHIFEDALSLAHKIANHIGSLIRERNSKGLNTVLGLPTGSTPLDVYKELIRLHQEEDLDFSRVITFDLAEYYPIEPDQLQSYYRFLRENLLNHINVPSDQTHGLPGNLSESEVDQWCHSYEDKIREAGGLDLVLLRIGRSGHIAFNEPGSSKTDRTRKVILDSITRKDASGHFFGDDHVPLHGITVGVGTILDSREIVLMATGEGKAGIIRRAVEETINEEVTASYLREHPKSAVFLDRAAAGSLTREQTPWLVYDVEWDLEMAKRAVIWLSERVGKAILQLEEADFHNNRLYSLVYAYPHIDELCLTVFDDLRRRIYYQNQLPSNERVILFSPHPDDDVISMGGMLDKLVRNNNEIIVAYMTNGSVAVFDADVSRNLGFIEMCLQELGITGDASEAFRSNREEILSFLAKKAPGEVDLPAVQRIKSAIRYSEAIAGIEVMGLDQSHARFIDLPFYQTGRIKKKPVGQDDANIIIDLMNEQNPDHIFVAGDLSDPHGTHRICYVAIQMALEQYNKARGVQGPRVWLYRGAWQEWEIHQADVFTPISRTEMARKIEAIFKHESQKDRAMFPGAYDDREFWQRARDRNTGTAEALNRLGLPEFYGAEAFVTGYSL